MATNIYDMTDSWTDGSTYTAVKMNVTDTSSNAASLLMDFQVGGTQKFAVKKDGSIQLNAGQTQLLSPFNGTFSVRSSTATSSCFYADGVGAVLQSDGYYAFSSSATNAESTVDTWIARASAGAFRYSGTSASSLVSARTELQKAVASIADNTATATFTVTVPNAAHSAMLKVTLVGSLGAGGAVGANEATGTISYDFAIARTAGVDTVVGASSAYGSSTAAVAGATTITVTAAASAMTGASSATQTFTINVTIAKGGGSSANHTCLCYGRLINANASGVTIS